MDILFALIIFIVGVSYGWHLREKVAEHKMHKMMETMEHLQEEEDDRIPVKVERVDEQFMVYDEINGQFMAQGNTWSDIENRLIERFPGKRFRASIENLKEMGIKL